ncbi:MAG: helix-turn-helix transcriptional regulator [Ruminococcaceae bacterium]|nr:helix-turn-helix transcriptional regulator [Oscillospiraceae bacterium]
MQIKLGEKIKELRKRDGRKQEDLAAALGVTNQAVSRWEANGGYPDIEMLPAIANYFHITIDKLFGYDNDRQIKLQSYIDQADQMCKRVHSYMDQADQTLKRKESELLVEFLRNAISEFPSEWQLQYRLAGALQSMAYQKDKTRVTTAEGYDYFRYDTEKNAQNEYLKEAISLYEGVLKKEIDDSYRTAAILSLMTLYSLIGDFENAERTALSQPPVRISRELLLVWAAEDEKGDQYRGEAILALMYELNGVISSSVMIKHSLANSQSGLDKLLAVARLYESIFDDGNYGPFHNDLCLLYLRCSLIAVHLKDFEHALNYFEIALDHFIEFKQERENFRFTAPLVRKANNIVTGICALDREFFEQHMQSFPAECANSIRNNPKYSPIFAQ